MLATGVEDLDVVEHRSFVAELADRLHVLLVLVEEDELRVLDEAADSVVQLAVGDRAAAADRAALPDLVAVPCYVLELVEVLFVR